MSLKERLGFTVEPLYIMDGTAFLYRGFFANANMSRSDGLPTGALFIVGRVLLKLLREECPEYFAFIMDGRGKNFRHDLYPEYKANRPSAPEGLVRQIEPVQRMVRNLGLYLEVSEQCEADDCIASLVKRFSPERPVVIIGMDKDLRQCLAPNVVLWDPSSKVEKLVTLDSFQEETGLTPSQWPDVQALIGDSSDNVPGVKGIGPKTAEALFREFRSLEDIRDRYEQVEPKIKKKLDGNLDAMFLYRQLTTLATDQCQSITLEKLKPQPLQGNEALTLFDEFEINFLKRELKELMQSGLVQCDGIALAKGVDNGQTQLSLFTAPQPVVQTLAMVNSVEELPQAQGKVVALVPPPAALQRARQNIGSADTMDCVLALMQETETIWEARYTGSTLPLKEWASGAERVVVPDLKHLLGQQTCWMDLPAAIWFDLSLGAYLLAPEDRDYSWPRLSAHYAEKSGISQNQPGELALALYKELVSRLDQAGLTPLLQNLEIPLVPVLFSMEQAGIKIDMQTLHDFLAEVQKDLEELTREIYALAEGEFNIRSAQQMGEVLYKRLGLPAGKSTTGGQASTSQEVLEKLSLHHPVVGKILEFRKLEKMRSTYLEPLPRLCGPDGRIHTHFNQTATATGRLSSSNPNLQNIPIRGDMGKRMRTCFIAEEGNMLISGDYSQVELRILAHYTQDPTLLAAFRHGEDIHTRTASLLYDVAPEAITAEQRRGAKTINFGLLYGMGARKLANSLGITQTEAKAFMERYFARFTRVKDFYDQVEEEARTNGYVTTISGRRRPLPDMHSASPQARATAERQAVNTQIQGSAADIMKYAMLTVYADEGLKRHGARMLLQVHDELVLEVPQEYAQACSDRLCDLMCDLSGSGIALSIPLVVDCGFGKDWGTAH